MKLKISLKMGKEYWVKSIINPIVNSDNKIIEYISIKSDVTFEHKMKDYFEKQLNISSKKFSEALICLKSMKMQLIIVIYYHEQI